MLILDPNSVPRIKRILDSDLPVERKISKLQIMALRSFPSSPMQIAVNAARKALEQA